MPDPSPPHPRRAAPLRAPRVEPPARTAADEASAGEPGDAGGPAGRRWSLVVAAALGVGIATVAIVYGIIAIVVYPAAMTSADGINAPFVRTAFLRVALPAGVVFGVAAGGLVGAWLARGGRLPTDRASMFDR